MKKRWVQIGLVSLLIIVLIIINRTVLDLSPEAIKAQILSIGIWAPVLFVIVYTFRPLILFPASVLSLAGGLAFGPALGTALTVTGASLGAALAFFVARKIGKGKWQWKNGGKTAFIQKKVEGNGFTVVLLLRLIPLFNFDLISYAAGASKVRFSHFFSGTVAGIIPGTFAYNFLGSSAASQNNMIIIAAIAFFIILTIVPVLFKNKIKRYLENH
ncbi:TVP38/TMEM64 family protein [Bacillus sp. P14.5]|uniref:TVP38/TMEM64 family protein n=1 Tax=Bacillus sp. P14.5 TaxID=1983400 RepID=UPI001F052B5B|nr:TVP38/TMEM64 family protein [Bacillus sp. P14.5]